MSIIYQLSLGEDGPFSDPLWRNDKSNADYVSIDVVSNVTAGSGKSLKFSIISDGTPDSTYRSEISSVVAGGSANNAIVGSMPPGTERWIGFSCMYDPEASPFTSADSSVFQILSHYTGYNPQQPNISIHQMNGRFFLVVRYDLRENSPDESTIQTARSIDLGKCNVGEWNRFVVHVILGIDNTALTEIYMDNLLRARVNSPNAYNRKDGNGVVLPQYVKFGNYSYSWRYAPATAGTISTWNLDQILIGDSSSNLAEMMDVDTSHPLPKPISGYA